MVGGVVLIAAPPFTGGGSAVVGVIFITTAAAGTAATLMSVQERYEKEGTLKIDGRLALDVLQLVSTFMAAGSFSNAFKAWGTVAKGMYLGTMLGLDITQGVLIATDVKEQLLAVEAVYKPKILAATDPDEKAKLERERDSALAQILGHAMLSGSFILVSIGTGIHQIRSVGKLSGKSYTVREEIKKIVDTGDHAAIREALEKKPVNFEDAQIATAKKVKELRELRAAESDPAKRAALDADIEATLAAVRGDLEAMVKKAHPSLEPVDPSKNLYKIAIDGKEYFGTLETLLDFTAPSTAARAAGDRLFATGSKTGDATVEVSSGLGGTGAQGRVNKHPGDVDLTENMHVEAKSASAAAEALAKTIQTSVEAGGHPGPNGEPPLVFDRMVLGKIPEGAKAGKAAVWTKADIARGYIQYVDAAGATKQFSLADATAKSDGNAIAYWNGPVDAKGTYGEITKAIRYEAVGTNGAKLFGTPEIGQAYQQVTFDKPPVIHDLNRPWLTDELTRQIASEAHDGNWLKAAKRAYTVARLNGDVHAMSELEPFLAGDPAKTRVVSEHLGMFIDDVVKTSGKAAKGSAMTPETARANAEMLADRVGEIDAALGKKMKALITTTTDVRGNKNLGVKLKTDVLNPLAAKSSSDSAFADAVQKALKDLGYLK